MSTYNSNYTLKTGRVRACERLYSHLMLLFVSEIQLREVSFPQAPNCFSIETIMERKASSSSVLSLALIAFLATISCLSSLSAADSKVTFDDNFSKSCPETNFKTSEDGQTWHLSLNKKAGFYSFICIFCPKCFMIRDLSILH